MTIIECFERWARSHSWYKHLRVEGKEFLVVPRENFTKWDFISIDDVREIKDPFLRTVCLEHRITANCFLRGLEPSTGLPRGYAVIKQRYPGIAEWMEGKYSSNKFKVAENLPSGPPESQFSPEDQYLRWVFHSEYQRTLQEVKHQALEIFIGLQESKEGQSLDGDRLASWAV